MARACLGSQTGSPCREGRSWRFGVVKPKWVTNKCDVCKQLRCPKHCGCTELGIVDALDEYDAPVHRKNPALQILERHTQAVLLDVFQPELEHWMPKSEAMILTAQALKFVEQGFKQKPTGEPRCLPVVCAAALAHLSFAVVWEEGFPLRDLRRGGCAVWVSQRTEEMDTWKIKRGTIRQAAFLKLQSHITSFGFLKTAEFAKSIQAAVAYILTPNHEAYSP